MRVNAHEEVRLRPLVHTGTGFYATVLVLLVLSGVFLYAWVNQLTNGMVVTGLRDWGLPLSGSPWGFYIGNFIWFVGMAHGGIAISAAIRLLRLEKYRPIARMAELLTLVALLMAGLSIVLDLGRPDRVFNIIRYWPERVGHSPLTWDMTVIALYFVFSATYLFLTMRRDLHRCSQRFPERRLFYRPFLVGYSPDEGPKVKRIAWWLAISLLLLLVLLSGGVIPWLFGLMASQMGWFGAVQGPYFLVAALASAIAGVIFLAALLRRVFHWEELIPVELFRGLGTVLAVLVLAYMWLILHEHLTAQFAGPTPEHEISRALLTGRFAPLFWIMFSGLAIPFFYLSVQTIYQRAFRLPWMVAASVVVLLALWLKRFIILVGSLLHPRLSLYPSGDYSPTWVEYSMVIGTLAIAALLYMAFMKIYPIVELTEEEEE